VCGYVPVLSTTSPSNLDDVIEFIALIKVIPRIPGMVFSRCWDNQDSGIISKTD
jgi:hypothetical protein